MATLYTLSGTLVDLGLSPLAGGTPYVTVLTNMPNGHPVMDSAGHVIMPSTRVPVNSDGSWSVDLIDTDATDLNIEANTLLYTLLAEGTPDGTRTSSRVKVERFPLTTSQRIDQVDADSPAVSPSWRSAFRDEMEQIKDEVRDISNIDTPDALVATLVPASSGSATAAALNAAIGEQADPALRARYLADLMRSPASGVRLTRYAEGYRFLAHLGGQRWHETDFRSYSGDPVWPSPVHQIHHDRIVSPVLSHDVTHTTVTRVGAGWRLALGPGNELPSDSYGGTHDRSAEAGDYIEFDLSGVDAVRVGIHFTRAQNGGYAVATIDGSGAKCDLLPTAQHEVDEGRLAASALVANGGTINPTDRLMEYYTSADTLRRQTRIISSTLDGTEVALRLTVTGYGRNGATGVTVYSSGWGYGEPDTTLTTPNALAMVEFEILGTYIHGSGPVQANNSAREPTHRVSIAGGTPYSLGQVHGYETETGLTFTVDGSPVTLAVGESADGSVIECVRTTTLHHPDASAGADIIGTVTNLYRITSDGLDLVHRVVWSITAQDRATWIMRPVNGEHFPKGGLTIGNDLELLDSVGSGKGYRKADTAYLWGDHPYAVLVQVPDPDITLAGWRFAHGTWTFVEDRTKSGGNMHKIYMGRVVPSSPEMEPIVPGKVVRMRATYRVARLASPEITLARD